MEQRSPTSGQSGSRHQPASNDYSLALGRLVAARLVDEPERVLAKARRNLVVMEQAHLDGRVAPWLSRWRMLLDSSVDDVVAVLITDDEDSRTLRQNSPFAGVLSPHERWAALRDVRARRRGAA